MQMVRLIYVSRMTEACDIEEIGRILEVSRARNKALDITGILCYDPAFFLQYLEGPRDGVNELYSDILRDARHRDVLLLLYNDVTGEERLFADWQMAFLRAKNLSADLISNVTGSQKLDPYSLNATQAGDLLLEVSRCIDYELFETFPK